MLLRLARRGSEDAFRRLYRELYTMGVRCVLQSFYNARQDGPSVHTQIMRQTMQYHAATNAFWVSMSNPSGYYAPNPSCFIQPDGAIVRQLQANRSGMLLGDVDLDERFYDPMEGFREMAISGRLTNVFRVWQGGLRVYGGIAAAFGVAFFILRRRKLDAWEYMDLLVVALPLGIGIARIGCVLNGCCFGKPSGQGSRGFRAGSNTTDDYKI